MQYIHKWGSALPDEDMLINIIHKINAKLLEYMYLVIIMFKLSIY